MLKKSSSLCLFFLLIGLNGCKVGPEYRPPVTEIPAKWKNELTSEIDKETCEDLGCWWEIFEDPILSELEEKAIANNQDIEIAVSRVKQEWTQAGIKESDFFPQVWTSPTVIDLRTLVNTVTPTTLPKIPPFRYHLKEYIIPLVYSYQADFWRKNWYDTASAYETAEEEEENLRNVLLTVTTDVALNYFQMRAYDQQISLLKKAVQVRQDSFDINTDRYETGLISYIDVVQAKSELYSAIANQEDLIRSRGESENLIALLIGENASEFTLPSNPLDKEPPVLPMTLPSELLLRRPDIASAEREMASRNSQIGFSIASFFPSFQITGAVGSASPDAKQLFSWLARLSFIQVQAMQTLFDAGKLYEKYLKAKYEYQEAVYKYQKQVLTAFREVEDALIGINQRKEQRKALIERMHLAQESADLTMDRYNTGLVNYLEVVIELRNQLSSELDEQNVLGSQYLDLIKLIKALGGCW